MKQFLTIICLLFFAFGISRASAVELSFDSPESKIGLGRSIALEVLVDFQGEAVNTLEGRILIPESFEVLNINTAGSVINFWIQEPKIETDGIHFSGIIPGGFGGQLSDGTGTGNTLEILKLILEAEKEDINSITVTDIKAFLNDGFGTETGVVAKLWLYEISKSYTGGGVEVIFDSEPPEDFKPEIARDETVFSGQYFVVFSTQDKESGIKRYEIAERRGIKTRNYSVLNWKIAKSPYILEDQKIRSYVYIKVIDNTGNERIVVISPRYLLGWQYYLLILVIIMGVSFVYIKTKLKIL